MREPNKPGATSQTSKGPQPLVFGPPRGGPAGLLAGGQKAKNTRGTLRRLWTYLRSQTWALVGVVLLVALTSALDLLGPYLTSLAIDTAILKGDLPMLARLAAVVPVGRPAEVSIRPLFQHAALPPEAKVEVALCERDTRRRGTP